MIVAALILVFGVSLIFLIKKPIRLLYALVLLPGVVDLLWEYEIYGVSVLDLFYGLFFIMSVFVLFFGKEVHSYKLPIHYLWLYVSFFFPIIFLFIDGFFFTGLSYFIKISYGLISYLLAAKYLRVENHKTFTYFLASGILLSLLIFSYQLVTGMGVDYSQYSYGTAFYADEGTLSRKAIYAIILFFPFKGNIFLKYKWLYFPVLIFAFATLGLSVSRNAIAAAIALVIFYTIYKKSLGTSLLLAVLIPILFFSVDTISQGLYNKVEKELNYFQGRSTVNVETLGSGRIGRWKSAIDDFEDSPTVEKIFGTGRGIGPHGQFFDLLLRGGIFSIVTFVFFFGKVTLDVYRKLGSIKFDYIPLYLFQFLLAFWILCVGATPLYNFQLLIIIFSLYGLLDKILFVEMKNRYKPIPRSYPPSPIENYTHTF